MQLVADIGNTQSKIAIFDDRKMVALKNAAHESTNVTVHELVNTMPIDVIGYANVGSSTFNLDDEVQGIKPIQITTSTPAPITSSYASQETLGIDRWCGAIAANHYYPNASVLSIDMGTCITYDLISNSEYLGGGIAPGYAMRLRAMHQLTARLPVVDTSSTIIEFGKDTPSSMLFGAGFGMVAEVNGIIQHFKAQHPDLKVILTGGDLPTFEQRIENPIFAAPNLVLEGINEILLFQSEH